MVKSLALQFADRGDVKFATMDSNCKDIDKVRSLLSVGVEDTVLVLIRPGRDSAAEIFDNNGQAPGFQAVKVFVKKMLRESSAISHDEL